MRPFGSFTISATSGSVEKYEDFFPGATVKMDDTFRNVIGTEFTAPKMVGSMYPCLNGGKFIDTVAIETFGPKVMLVSSRASSVLFYIGHEGIQFVYIPDGKNTINIILGYGRVSGDWYVFYVKRQLQQDEEEIWLRAQPLNQWNDDDPVVILVT